MSQVFSLTQLPYPPTLITKGGAGPNVCREEAIQSKLWKQCFLIKLAKNFAFFGGGNDRIDALDLALRMTG